MKTVSDRLQELLARKGAVTIVEHVGGKPIVALQARGGVLTLQGGTKNELLAELCKLCKDWPDTREGE